MHGDFAFEAGIPTCSDSRPIRMGTEVPAANRLPAIVRVALAALLLAATAEPRSAIAAFTAFESGHTHALALSADRTRLYALNTPDNRLEIFEVSDTGLLHLSSVPVGLEPVSVAERVPGEVWVVNRISDDVSIVSTVGTPRVVRTLLIGDEPADVVFAGVGRNRAFVTTARRGQNSPIQAQYLMPGIGRALVFVYDATDLGAAAGGEPIAVLELFGDAPRALAANADGSIVYAAIFHSGNRTTTIPASLVTVDGRHAAPEHERGRWSTGAAGAGAAAGADRPLRRCLGPVARRREPQLEPFVPFTLPDADVFAFNANASPAAMQASIVPYAHVGTVLFNMAVNPADGRVFVTNSDARNERRFEGAGNALASFPALPQKTVRGRLHQYRVTVIDPNTSAVTPRHLNKHIDYDLTPEATAATDTADRSLATPLDVVIDAAGDNLYVAAFGSDKVGVLSPDALADDSFTPDDADHIGISGGGPTSLALDEPRERLYVLARFGQSISVVDLTDHPGSEIAVVPLPHDPEPASLRNGRRFLYDARLTSSNGEASCSSCHIFGNTDDLVWNLGDPDGVTRMNANLQAISTWGLDNLDNIDFAMEVLHQQDFLPDNFYLEHHPLKGPLFTKSMRGLANGGPMHWGGDRSGGVGVRDDPDSLDEDAAFKSFNVAFRGLLGRTGPLSVPEMQAFTDFMLQVVYPPNPNRALDNSLTPAQASAKNIFLNVNVHSRVPAVPNEFKCADCHALNPAAGFFGSGGRSSFRSDRTQILKVPHLRNLYSLAGMFGVPKNMPTPTGAQIRSVGLQHDGSVDTLLSFVQDPMLRFPGANEAEKAQNRLDMVDFLLAFDTESAPVLGQQVTLDDEGPTSPLLPSAGGTVQNRVNLLAARALVTAPIPECDLIVKAAFDGEPRGWWMSGANAFRPDRDGAATVTLGTLQSHADTPGRELTFMCVPPGSGERFGIDRDADGTRDGSQCGDVNLDGVVATNDATLLRRALARVPGAALPLGRKCNAIGTRDLGDVDGDLVPNDCDILDAAVLARDAAALAPGAAQVCGSAESCASDPDGDYVCGSVDNCPTTANPDQADADGDGVGDACDSCPTDVANDPDADGVCDSVDNCPGVANPSQANADADSQGDACDADDDGDALLDGADNCSLVANPGQENADGDAFGDACDACPADAANDADADGHCADVDNCPAVANPSQANADGDALGDACDACPADAANDADADGHCANADNCPAVANSGQENADGDAFGDACDACPADPANDADGDGHCASVDNCPTVANPSQANSDSDALGDACDACPADSANDADADGHCADVDNCPTDREPDPGERRQRRARRCLRRLPRRRRERRRRRRPLRGRRQLPDDREPGAGGHGRGRDRRRLRALSAARHRTAGRCPAVGGCGARARCVLYDARMAQRQEQEDAQTQVTEVATERAAHAAADLDARTGPRELLRPRRRRGRGAGRPGASGLADLEGAPGPAEAGGPAPEARAHDRGHALTPRSLRGRDALREGERREGDRAPELPLRLAAGQAGGLRRGSRGAARERAATSRQPNRSRARRRRASARGPGRRRGAASGRARRSRSACAGP